MTTIWTDSARQETKTDEKDDTYMIQHRFMNLGAGWEYHQVTPFKTNQIDSWFNTHH